MPTPRPPSPYADQIRAARALQQSLADQFSPDGFPANPRYIGGADIAFATATDGSRTGAVGSTGVAVAVIIDLTTGQPAAAAIAHAPITFPYIPGLLSFREEPLLLAAIHLLPFQPDLWIFDGQGRSHPRQAGLATHMGIRLNAPAIGAAKSLLLGHYDPPPHLTALLKRKTPPTTYPRPLATAPVLHKGIEIARALWMKPRTDPVIVSQGHRCTLDQATTLTAAATLPGQWLPEPTRLADALTKQLRNTPLAQARTHLTTLLSPKP